MQSCLSDADFEIRDELLYDARIHPEQYSNTLSDAQIQQLHNSLHYVCSLAVETKADSSKFPGTWLFKHRWGKGKKDSPNRLPNGEKIVFLTVGGRTSAVIPSVQKKTGPVKADVKSEDKDDGSEDNEEYTEVVKGKLKKGKKRSSQKGKMAKVEDIKPEPKLEPESIPEPSIATRKQPSRTTKSTIPEEPAFPTPKRKSIPSSTDRKRKQPSLKENPSSAKDDTKDEGGDYEKEPIPNDEEKEQPPTAKRQKPTKTKASAEQKQVNGTGTKHRCNGRATVPSKADLGNRTARRRSARVSGVGA